MKNGGIATSVIRLWFEESNADFQFESSHIRGAIATLHPDQILLHQHIGSEVIYSYPLVQYKCVGEECIIVGIQEGARAVESLNLMGKTLTLNKKDFRISKKDTLFGTNIFGMSKLHCGPYSFLTPWLALNQKNYEKYQMLGTWSERKEMLEKILVGNLISMSKSLGYTVPGPIEARIGGMREVKTSLKGTPMAGFLGDFSVNFEIPDYWGIGKSVSRGFGTVKRVEEFKS